ncbi:MAG: hypothetical protein ACYDEE_03755 [Ignavibacteriaceae bacterium]
MDYPESFLKGITDNQYLDEDGGVAANLFYFDPKKNVPEREDGYNEESIFWRDDENAVTLILSQRKNENIQFKYGAAVVKLEEIDRLKKLRQYQDILSYERKRLEDNPYHGNLLLSKNTGKQVMRKLAGAIATVCQEIIPQETNESLLQK